MEAGALQIQGYPRLSSKFKASLECLGKLEKGQGGGLVWKGRENLPGAAQNSRVFEVSGPSTVSKQELWEVDKDISAWGQEGSGIRVGVKRMEGFREVGMGTMNES